MHLAEHEYHQAKHSPCLFMRKSNRVAFTFVAKGYMDLSMPGYLANALTILNKLDMKGANAPIVYIPIVYGA